MSKKNDGKPQGNETQPSKKGTKKTPKPAEGDRLQDQQAESEERFHSCGEDQEMKDVVATGKSDVKANRVSEPQEEQEEEKKMHTQSNLGKRKSTEEHQDFFKHVDIHIKRDAEPRRQESDDYFEIEFLCYHSCLKNFKVTNEFHLEILSPAFLNHTFPMKKLTEEIISCKAYLPKSSFLQAKDQIEYRYSLKDYNKYQCANIKRPLKYLRLNRLFDTPETFECSYIYNTYKQNLPGNKLLSQYFHFGIDQFKQNQQGSYKSALFFKDLALFYKANAFTLHFAELFQELKKLLSLAVSMKEKSWVVPYILKIVFVTKSVEWPSDTFKKDASHYREFVNLMTLLGRDDISDNLVSMYLQAIENETDKEEKESLIGGLKLLINEHPNISLKLIDYPEIVNRHDDVIKNLINQSSRTPLESLKMIDNELMRSPKNSKLLDAFRQAKDKVLKSLRTFDDIIKLCENGGQYFDVNDLKPSYDSIKSRNTSPVTQFVRDKFAQIICQGAAEELFKLDIIKAVEESFQVSSMVIKTFLANVVEKRPTQYLTSSLIERICSSINKRDTFELLIYVFKMLSPRPINVLTKPQTIEDLINFTLKPPQALNMIQDLSTLRLTFDKREGFYNVRDKQRILNQIDLAFKNRIRQITDKEILEPFTANVNSIPPKLEGFDSTKELSKLYIERVAFALKNCCKNLKESEQFLKLLTPEGHRLKCESFEPLLAPLAEQVQSALTETVDKIASQPVLVLIAKIDAQRQYSAFQTLRIKVKQFVDKINRQDVTLQMAGLLQDGSAVLNLLNTWFRFDVRHENLQFMRQIFTEFTEKLDKYRSCMEWIKLFSAAMKRAGNKQGIFKKKYMAQLEQAKNLIDQVTVAQYIEDGKNAFRYFEEISVFGSRLALLYKLQESKIFKRIYQDAVEGYFRTEVVEKDEGPEALLMMDEDAVGEMITEQEFDTISSKVIESSVQLGLLKDYPQTKLTIGDVKKYYCIQGVNLNQELDCIARVFKFDIDKIRTLLNHIEIYNSRNLLQKNGQILLKLGFLIQDHSVYEFASKLIEKFLKKMESCNDSTSLSSFVADANGVKQLYTQIESERDLPQISALEEFARGKELFEFAIEQKELNFNDLYERLDDNTLLTSTTISDMNAVSMFCNKVKEQIETFRNAMSIPDLAKVVLRAIKRESDAVNSFPLKLKNCIDSVHALKVVSTASLNQSENTIKIVEYVMTNGKLTVQRLERSCEFIIRYTDQAGVMFSLPNDDISRHCNRALLLLHSKTKEAQRLHRGEDEEMKDQEQLDHDYLFEQQVLTFNEMIENLGRLTQSYDKLYYSGLFCEQNTPTVYLNEVNINIRSIKSLLKDEIIESEERLGQWNELLLLARENHFFLTYIPNQILYHLREYFKAPELFTERLAVIENVFKLIDKRFTFDQIDELEGRQVLNEEDLGESAALQIIGHSLQDLFNPEDNIILNIQQDALQRNRIKIEELLRCERIFRVQSEVDTVRAIVTIFRNCCFAKPSNWNVLVCTPHTVISEIENFVLRAQRFPLEVVCPFVIADYQRLPLHVQLEAYLFIESRGILQSGSLLLILFNQGVRESGMIEQFQGKRVFPQMAENRELQEFFKNHSNAMIITSSGTGFGKSDQIERQIKSEGREYLRIIISGEMTAEKFIDLHLEKGARSRDIGYHYDMHPCSQVTMLLFQALILKCVVAGDEKILHFPENSSFHIEIADSMNSSITTSIFSFIQEFPQNWDLNQLQVDMTLESNIQVLAHFLSQTQPIPSIDAFLNQVRQTALPKERCIALIQEKIPNFKSMNYYLVNAFIDLAGDQLRRLYQSAFFFSDEILADQFGGNQGKQFFNQMKDLIINLSLEVTLSSQGLQNQKNALANMPLEEQQMHRLEGLKWENSQNLFILLNDSGTILPIFRDPSHLPTCLTTFYQQYQNYKIDLQPFETLSPLQVLERMSRIFGHSLEEIEFSMVTRSIDIGRISFTRDNFMKLAFIYMRLRIGQSVIIMGETGVGKTAVINYLADVLNYEFRILNLHEGVTEEDILTFVQEASIYAQRNPSQNVLLFFDEINTNTHIDGLLKEIVIDRRVKGERLESNIRLVAACNPYQIKNQQDNGAIEGVSAGLQHQKFKSKLSMLVYTVRPLPESFFMYLWDYGSLSQDEEYKIILKIISSINHHENLKSDKVSERDIVHIANCVSFAQTYTRRNEAKWAVSLRDVSRFQKLFCYFYKNNSLQFQKRGLFSVGPTSFSHQERAFTLAICFCYYFRIQNKEKRNQFKNELEQFSRRMSYNLNRHRLENILAEEYKCFLDEMEIPSGIGRNTPLKENIFVIFTCLMNKIPLFVTGKPGSSKTLAMNLVMKSMKGKSSSKEFFKNLPAVLPFSYQGSLQSTSAGIQRVFDRAIKCQKGIQEKKENTIVLVTIDEIGLAEISPNNPLKVLHSLLEPPQVAVVGISNWALDASKMNRGITLSRPDPDMSDLLESAESINEHINAYDERKIHYINERFMKGLADGYLQYIQYQRSNFHGLRDFYSLIQQVSQTVQTSRFLSESQHNLVAVIKAVERNFGGLDTREAVICFGHALCLNDLAQNFQPSSTAELIRQNMHDRGSRHMMLIARDDDEDEAYSLVQEVLNKENIEHKFFQGSDFPDDETEDAAYRLINDIILCMERGISCVLINQSIVYQSFYDMLNQNYQVVNNQSFCRVAIGADSTRCLVHPDFRCIVIVSEQGVKNMDPPLLNRFEKQKFQRSDLLQGKAYLQVCVEDLTQWIKNMEDSQGQGFAPHDLFPVNVKLNISKLVAQINPSIESEMDVDEVSSLADVPERRGLGYEEYFNLCRGKIIQMGTFHGLFRATDTQHIESINLRTDLKALIDSKLEALDSKTNLMIYTYQATDINLIADEIQAGFIDLDLITSRRRFEEKASEALKRHPFLIVYANAISNSIQRIKLCKNILVSINSEERQRQKSRIIFIVKLTDPKGQDEKHACSYSPLWEEVLVEVLNGKGHTNIQACKMVNCQDMKHLLNYDEVAIELARDNIAGILSKINYQIHQDQLSERINIIKLALINMSRQLFGYFQRQLEGLIDDGSDWRIMVSKNSHLMNSRNTFHSAAYEYLSRVVIKYFSFIVFLMEHDGVLQALIRHSNGDRINIENVLECFEHQVRTKYHGTLTHQLVGTQQEKFAITKFTSYSFDIPNVFEFAPFTRHLHAQIMSMKPFFKESMDQEGINEVFERRFEASMQSHFQRLQLQSHEAVQHYMENFPLLMQFELSAKVKDDSSSLIMQFLKLEIGKMDRRPMITDLYIAYWTIENFIEDIRKVIAVLVPDVLSSAQWSDHLGANPGEEIAEKCVRSLCHLVKPHDDLLLHCQLNRVDWIGKVSDAVAIMEDSESLKGYLPTCRVYKEIKFLLNIGVNMIKPFNMDSKLLGRVLEALEQYNLEEQPEDLIQEVYGIFDEQNIEENQEEQNQQFTRLVYQYLEARLESTNDAERLQALTQTVVSCLGMDYENRDLKDPRFNGNAHSLLRTLLAKVLSINDVPFFSLESESEILNELDGLLGNLEATCEHPFAVLLTDVLEKTLYQEREVNDRCLSEAIDFILRDDPAVEEVKMEEDDQQPLHSLKVRTLIALAHFRHAAKHLVTNYIQAKSQGYEVLGDAASQMILRVLEGKFNQGSKSKALIVYVVKLLKQQSLTLQQILEKGEGFLPSNVMPWLSHINLLDIASYKSFQAQVDGAVTQTQSIIDKIEDSKQLKAYLQAELRQPNSKKELAITQALIEILYMNGRPGAGPRLAVIEAFNVQQRPQPQQDFLLNIIGQRPLQDQSPLGRDMLAAPKTGYLPELITFIGSCTISSTGFLKKFLNSVYTDQIKQMFIPFVANTPMDFEYQSLFAHGDSFRRYRCRSCQQIVCVVDCGGLGHDRGRGSYMNCRGCGIRIGWNTQDQLVSVDAGLVNAASFKAVNEAEAARSYVKIDADQYEVTNIRDLANAVKLIGSIVIHGVLLVALLFSSNQNQQRICALFQVRNSDDAYTYLTDHIKRAWACLMRNYQLNNEMLLSLIEYVTYQLTVKEADQPLLFESLATFAGRKAFEAHFQAHIIPNYPQCLSDNFTQCISLLQRQKIILDLVANSIEEVVNIDEQEELTKLTNFFSIFRTQSTVNLQSFKWFISSPQNQENPHPKMIGQVFKSLPSLEHIHHLQPLLQWVQYVHKRLNRVVKYNTAYDKSISEVIDEHLPEAERQKARKLAQDYVIAWNQIQKDIKEIGEACDTLQLQSLSVQNSKFLYCCMTNKSKDQLGFHLFLVLRYLAGKQNDFLQQVAQSDKRVGLLEVKPEQILQVGGDDVEALIVRLLNETSFIELKYGHGREIHYDTERISTKLREQLILGLVQIDCDEDISFEFANLIEESNPYEQYSDIQSKVGRQERCIDTPRLLELVYSNEDRAILLSQLRLTMTFLQQTGGDPEKLLFEYMRAFSIDKCLREIQEFQSIRLKHVLDIFEKTEEALHRDLVEKTQPNYQQSISVQDRQVLEGILKKLKDEDLQLIRAAMGRLCIRQLSASQVYGDQQRLFPILFLEDNSYLFGIADDTAAKQAELNDQFFSVSTLTLGQAYYTYKILVEVDERRVQELLDYQEKERAIKAANELRIQHEQEQARQEMNGGITTPGFIKPQAKPEMNLSDMMKTEGNETKKPAEEVKKRAGGYAFKKRQ